LTVKPYAPTHPRPAVAGPFSAAFFLIIAGLLAVSGTFRPDAARAEGSATLLTSGGYRPFLEYRTDFTQNSSIRRQTVVKVFVNPGDTLLLASSANGVGQGRIRYVEPSGVGALVSTAGTTGDIGNLAAELAGPLPAAGGYNAARIPVANGHGGVWEIHFVSPDSTDGSNPPELPVGSAWNQPANVGYVSAWDVTVHSSTGATVPGRAYVNQLAMNVGGPVANLSSQFFILTRDGFRYRLDANGVQPFGFNLFANNKGFTDAAGAPLYHSVNLSGALVHDPDALDTPADVTHKIFFNTPANDMPVTSPTPSGTTWLRLTSPVVPTVSNLTFTGADGTPGQAGSGLGGTFRFTASGNGNYVLRIDLDGNGSYFDPVDRTLAGSATPGVNSVVWDGKNGLGQRALASGSPSFVTARVSLLGGEVHFPYIDAENNTAGMILERQVGAFSPDDTLYYDDRPIGGGFALPPAGENSVTGGHKWSSFLGDIRGMDTWTYVPGIDAQLNLKLTIRDADLELVSKTHAPNPLLQGQAMTWTITARNNGPDSIFAATVLDTMPASLGALAVNSSSTLGGTQIASSGFAGQVFTATLAVMPPNGTATFVLGATVAANAASPIINRALALRGPDQGDADDPLRVGAGNNAKRDTARVVAVAPDLAITKSHTGIFTVAQNAVWNINVRNIGNGPTTGAITVTDTLPAGNTFVSATGTGWTITQANGIVTAIANAPLANGAQSAFTITVLVSQSAVPSTTNFASVTTPGDSNPGNNRGSDTVPVASVADLTLSKTHAAPFNVGQNGTYTLTVTNLGPGATSGSLSVTDTLPAGLTYVNAVGQNWLITHVGNAILAVYTPILPVNGTASFTVTAAAGLAAYPSVTNVAQVLGPNDPNHGNDRATDPTPVNGLADLTIDKRHTEDFVAPGTGHYRLVITNIGNIPTSGAITVSDTLPAGLTYVSAVANGFTTNAVGQAFTASTSQVFAPGDSAAIDLTVGITPAAVPGVINTASVQGGGDGNPFNNTDSDPTPVNGSPDLAIDKSHQGTFTVGLPNNYRLEVRNVGTVATTGTVTVRDTLPAGLGYLGGNGAGWSFANAGQVVTATYGAALAPDANTFCIINVSVGAAAVPGVTNAATVNTPGDRNPNNDRDTDPTPVNGLPDLAITKTHIGDFAIGAPATYSLLVRNVGQGPTIGTVTLLDTLPTGVTYVSSTQANGWNVVWSAPVLTATTTRTLAPQDADTLVFTVAIGQGIVDPQRASQEVVNTAHVITPGDTNPDNDASTDKAAVGARVAMSVIKEAFPPQVEIGDVVDYAIRVRNDGELFLSNVTVDDRLPQGFVYQRGSARLDGAPLADPAGTPGPQLVFVVDTLSVGRTARLTYRVAVGAGAAIGKDINTAVANAPGGNTSNIAQAAVIVRGGAFSDEGIIVGKVFMDCDCDSNRTQGAEELGIPGVRLYMEDGTSAVTDVEGKYHFANVRPRLHVVRIDATTLPPGARFAAFDNRHAGDGLSRFVDMQKGELHRADFAQMNRDSSVLRFVKVRRELGEVNHWLRERPEGIAVTPPNESRTYSQLTLRQTGIPQPTDPTGAYGVFIESPEGMKDDKTPVTVESDGARIIGPDQKPARDDDPVAPGVQRKLFSEGPPLRNMLLLEDPSMARDVKLRVTRGTEQDSTVVRFIPSTRTFFLAGLAEGRLDWRNKRDGALGGAPRDAFEDRLTDASFDSDSGRTHGAARGALFATAQAGNLGLLTLRYDSELDPSRRLFRDITPEQSYDVYGDASLHEFEGQSRSRFYGRVDNGANFAMFGDLNTPGNEARRLGAFSRALNGGVGHVEGHGLSAGAFISKGTSHMQVDEMPGMGVSGPYALRRADGLQNSERVEIITRDRNQPDRILRRDIMTRFADYTLEPFTGRLIFRHPVPSVDGDLDPVSIRVTYEVEGGTSSYWVGGAEAGADLGAHTHVGVAVSRDDDPLAGRDLASADLRMTLAPGATLSAEFARSDSARGGLSSSENDAARGEFSYSHDRSTLKAWALHAGRGFDNPAAGIEAGREELGASARLPLLASSSAFATALRSRNLANGARRDGLDLGVTQKLGSMLSADGALRWAQERDGALTPVSAFATPNITRSARGRLTAQVPGMKRASVFGEFEQDLSQESQRRGAFGADMQVAPRTRLYARHENIASFSGPFALNGDQQQATTVFGVSSDELREGSLFTEYRARDAFAGRDAQAAFGLRNRWAVARGVRLDASFERVTTLRGTTDTPRTDQTALTGGLDYTRSPLWKGTARVEWRTQDSHDHWFGTVGMARKLSQDWTALARGIYLDVPDDGQVDALSRFGVAYRQTDDDHWNALGRYEHHVQRSDASDSRVTSHLIATNANWRPVRPWILSGQLVGRWVSDKHAGIASKTNTELAASRVLWEFAPGWDAGGSVRGMFSRDFAARQFGLGGELGHTFVKNLRVAAGYNVFGFRDKDMTGVDRTDAGVFVRFGLKFDESLFGVDASPAPAVYGKEGVSR
jgi:uncharacterized repeat protein (TIGR01451 family)